jgi:hypothetical protein
MVSLVRPQLRKLHALSSGLAILLISTFLATTLLAEVSGDTNLITTVKQGIAYGLVVLIPTMAAVGLSGRQLAGNSTALLIQRKQRRMMLIAANGLFVMVPCALLLAWLATIEFFDIAFYLVQGIELIGGSVNITLLILNARLGMSMSRGSHRQGKKETC